MYDKTLYVKSTKFTPVKKIHIRWLWWLRHLECLFPGLSLVNNWRPKCTSKIYVQYWCLKFAPKFTSKRYHSKLKSQIYPSVSYSIIGQTEWCLLRLFLCWWGQYLQGVRLLYGFLGSPNLSPLTVLSTVQDVYYLIYTHFSLGQSNDRRWLRLFWQQFFCQRFCS